MTFKSNGVTGDSNSANLLLDKLTIMKLRLMEEKLQKELFIESNIKNGCIELAKARYIMGQSAVSATCLPSENSTEFSASRVCERVEEEGVQQVKVLDNEAEDTVNPMKWFGVLVPGNMHRAQALFKQATDYVVDCVNVQLQLNYVLDKIDVLKNFKHLQIE